MSVAAGGGVRSEVWVVAPGRLGVPAPGRHPSHAVLGPWARTRPPAGGDRPGPGSRTGQPVRPDRRRHRRGGADRRRRAGRRAGPVGRRAVRPPPGRPPRAGTSAGCSTGRPGTLHEVLPFPATGSTELGHPPSTPGHRVGGLRRLCGHRRRAGRAAPWSPCRSGPGAPGPRPGPSPSATTPSWSSPTPTTTGPGCWWRGTSRAAASWSCSTPAPGHAGATPTSPARSSGAGWWPATATVPSWPWRARAARRGSGSWSSTPAPGAA